MKDLSQVFAALRQKNKRQYALLLGCLFFSTLLITAFSLMMRSPTVLNVLPVGGDSRRMVMMIFVLAVVGCGAFTLYAAGLFFRHKSLEAGTFLALGASKRLLGRQLRREVSTISVAACVLGMALGTPLAWAIWSLFRLTLVNTPEMTLLFDFRAYGIALAFSMFAVAALLAMQSRFLRRTNILDIIGESHRAEPIRAVPRRYGPLGLILLVAGCVLGYFVPVFCVLVLHWYAPEWLTALAYLPALVGLHMLLLHTVVNGWRQGRSRYPHLIATGMMQLQGRQTVRNMLVITVLVAGAYFSAFYIPLQSTGAQLGFANRPQDYAFHYRADQRLPAEPEIHALAEEYGVAVREYTQQPAATLATDGMAVVETKEAFGTTYTHVYQELLQSTRFFSESAWNALTGDSLDLSPGTVAEVRSGEGGVGGDISLVTNPVTGQALAVQSVHPVLKHDLLYGCRVLDDSDYDAITLGLTDEWRDVQVFFNVEHDSYDFANRLFHEIVEASGPEVALCDGYDAIQRAQALQQGEPYPLDPEHAAAYGVPVIDYNQPDTSTFRMYWMYMPQFRVADQADFVTNMAVYLLLFVFVSILCFAAVGVILFTRSMTLAITNEWVYQDLRKLGAPGKYLYKTVRGQISRVFRAPILIGTLMILGFVVLILMGNGIGSGAGGISPYELAALGNCCLIVAAISAALYALYRGTLRAVCRKLKI